MGLFDLFKKKKGLYELLKFMRTKDGYNMLASVAITTFSILSNSNRYNVQVSISKEALEKLGFYLSEEDMVIFHTKWTEEFRTKWMEDLKKGTEDLKKGDYHGII
jgi:hypothetical protein